MTITGLGRWVFIDLNAHRLRVLLAALGVAVGIAALCFFLSLGSGLRQFALGSLAEQTDASLLEVVPASMELGVFRLNRPGLFGNTGLDAISLERLRHLNHVAAVYPRRLLRLPLGAEGGERFFGKAMYSDVIAEGLPAALLARGVTDKQALVIQTGQPIPVVINDQLLAVYNGSVADALHMPKLAREVAVGVTFNLIVGRSYLLGTTGSKKVETRRARLVGFSPYALRVGLTLPLEALDALEHEFQSEPSPPTYTSAVIQVDRADAATEVATAVEKLGLKIADNGRRTADAIQLAVIALSLIAGLVLVLATFNIGYTFFAQFLERRAELALLKALGAGPWSLLGLMLAQATFVGLLGGAVGTGLGYFLATFVDRALRNWVSDFPLRPEHFFVFGWSLLPLSLAVALLCAWLGVLIPTWRAVTDSPARVLSAVESD